MDWRVYILRCADGSLYTGVTNDLDNRMKAHSSGRGSKYVKSRRPFRLVFSEPAESRSEAQKREAGIKGLSRREKIRFISQNAKRRPQANEVV